MGSKTTKSSSVKNRANEKTTAPKVSRVRKSESNVAGSLMRSPAVEEIAARAYARFCQRGGEHGHDVEDWLSAERELLQPQ